MTDQTDDLGLEHDIASAAADDGGAHLDEGNEGLTVETVAKGVLDDAISLICGDRAKAYGPVRKDWQRTVDIFFAYTGIRLTPEEGLKFMICVKMSRDEHSHQRDNHTDRCGYDALLCGLEEESCS